jgi:anti-sigma regulatory factor (Ser/Thr protein kinase)
VSTKRAFRCRPEAVPAARKFVRNALRGEPAQVLEAAELMTSELATNCVRHAHTDFELEIELGAEIRIEVRDSGPGSPVRRSPEPPEPSGRGLLIVEAMADSWGVLPLEGGKAVWFTLTSGADRSGEVEGAGARARVPREGRARSRTLAPRSARRGGAHPPLPELSGPRRARRG